MSADDVLEQRLKMSVRTGLHKVSRFPELLVHEPPAIQNSSQHMNGCHGQQTHRIDTMYRIPPHISNYARSIHHARTGVCSTSAFPRQYTQCVHRVEARRLLVSPCYAYILLLVIKLTGISGMYISRAGDRVSARSRIA